MSVERITKRTGKAVWIGRPIQYYNYEDIRGVLERLAAIEDILGDTYDLDRLDSDYHKRRTSRRRKRIRDYAR